MPSSFRKTMLKVSIASLFFLASATTQAIQDSASENIEVIEVSSNKSVGFYRSQLKKAEEGFYDEFNKLTVDPKFKIQCKKEKPTGSSITVKYCHPQYVLTELAEQTQLALQTGLSRPRMEDVMSSLKEEQKEANDHMLKLLNEHPSLYQRFMNLRVSKQNLEKKLNK